MVDDLKDRLARYRADLDAAVLADLSRRQPGRRADVRPDHASLPLIPDSRAVTPDGDAGLGLGTDALELEPAQEGSGSPRRGIATRIVVLAASAAAIAATAAILIVRDDTSAPASVPAPTVTVADLPPSSVATTDSPTSTTSPTTTTTNPPLTVDDLLPPASAASSSPETGELVAAVAKVHDGAWYLYADGRLISIDDRRQDGPGWIEQRLTAEGVERVRFEFLASGLFDRSQQPSEAQSLSEDAFSRPAVRERGRMLVAHESTEPSTMDLLACAIDEPGTKCHLILYMRGLAMSLPEDEWADQQLRRYVPAKYAVCLTQTPGADGITNALTDLAGVVAMLPSPAPELLRDPEPTRDFFGAANSCFDLTTVETRMLVPAFIDAFGIPVALADSTYGFGTGEQLQLGSTTVDVDIQFWPLLPAGGIAIWGG